MIFRPAATSLWPQRIPQSLVALLILVVVGAWSAWDVHLDYEQVMEQEYRVLEVRARQHGARISGALRGVNLMLGSIIGDLHDFPAMTAAEQVQLLNHHLQQLPEIGNLLVTDASGHIQADTDEKVIGMDVSRHEYFRSHVDAPGDDTFHISAPFTTVTGRLATTQSRVIRDGAGKFAGVVVATLDSKFLDQALTLTSSESGNQAALINRKGDILNIVPPSDTLGRNIQGGIAYTEHVNSGQSMTRHLNRNKLSSVMKMSVFVDLPDAPLTVISSRDYADVIAGWQYALYVHVGGFILLAFTTIFFSWLAGHRQRSLVRARQQVAEHESELRTIIDTEPDCVKQIGIDGSLLSMNSAGLATIEADSIDQVIGMKLHELVAADYRDAFMDLVQRVHAGESGDLVFEIRGLKGRHRWLETHAVPLRDPQQRVIAMLGITRDITERRKIEADLRSFKAIVDSTDVAVISTSLEGIIQTWNRGAELIFGHSAGEMVGKPMQMLFPPDLRHEEPEILARIARGERVEHLETVWRHKDGHLIDLSSTISPILDERGKVIGASKIAQDITERKHMEEQIRQLAFHDPLTKLPNRRLLNDRLSQIMATSKRTGCYGAVMFLDLDNFKPLNDSHGHEVGDLLLIEVAERLKRCVREMDTVGRFGGDEFVVMLVELNANKDASTTQARIVAEKIRGLLAEPYRMSIRRDGEAATIIEHRCTASIGVALFLDHEASQDDILKWADLAMYDAKESGRNAIRFYAPKA